MENSRDRRHPSSLSGAPMSRVRAWLARRRRRPPSTPPPQAAHLPARPSQSATAPPGRNVRDASHQLALEMLAELLENPNNAPAHQSAPPHSQTHHALSVARRRGWPRGTVARRASDVELGRSWGPHGEVGPRREFHRDYERERGRQREHQRDPEREWMRMREPEETVYIASDSGGDMFDPTSSEEPRRILSEIVQLLGARLGENNSGPGGFASGGVTPVRSGGAHLIRRFPTFGVAKGDTVSGVSICMICLESLSDTVMLLPCLHVGHQSCMKMALMQDSRCPVCRRDCHAMTSDSVSLPSETDAASHGSFLDAGSV